MHIKPYILSLLAFLSSFVAFAQNYSAIEFIENKGQWNPQVRFTGAVPGGAFYIQPTGFTVVQNNPEEWAQLREAIHSHGKDVKKGSGETVSLPPLTKLRSHAYKVSFVNAAQNPQILADKPLPTYNNYFIGNDPSKWASECKIYQGITLKEVYPNVDVRYYSNNGQLKYDLIIRPGADVAKIGLKYEGVDKLEIKKGELVVGTSVGAVKELAPYSYQYAEKGKKEVAVKYKLQGNVVRFDIKGYDPSKTLIIDPTFIFASYSGSTVDNWGFTATYGPDGSMYGGGIVFGQGFPVNVGAYDQTFNPGGLFCASGTVDIGIIKLSPDGVNRVYATYIGGNGVDQPHSLIVDDASNLILAGRSNAADYPTTGTGLIGTGGGFDIVVTKLNASGSALLGSKRIGGTGKDGVNITECHGGDTSLQKNYGDGGRSEVILDGAGNIYVASSSQSTDFPVTGNAFQKTSGGKQDGVVLKFSADVSSLSFGSYLGGKGDDAAYVLSINPLTKQVYVAGGTNSNNFPGILASSLNGTNAGIDGFVSIISNNGSSLVKSTYLGTAATDQVYGLKFDHAGFPYIMGQTRGNWPIVNAAWSTAGAPQFIAKLQPDLSAFVYSTRFGTNSKIPNISPVAFLVDRCENVYVSGWGGVVNKGYESAGTSRLPIVNGLGLTRNDGSDFYFFVLKKNASAQLYGDVFGQYGGTADHVDGGTSRFDEDGVIYQAMCANCGGGPGMPAGGSWSPTNGSGGRCNLGMVKIALNLAGTAAGIQSSINGVPRDSSGCIPLTVDFRDTLLNAVTYEWDFTGDGVTDQITTAPNASFTYNTVGKYKVRLIAVDSTSCNMRDTSFVTIKAGDIEGKISIAGQRVLPCEQFQYNFVNTSQPSPRQPFAPRSFVWDFGDGSKPDTVDFPSAPLQHTFASVGTYKVKLYFLDPDYCNAPDVAELTVSFGPLKAEFTTPSKGCAPYNAIFTNTSTGAAAYLWNFGDGQTSSADNPSHVYTQAGTYVVTLTSTSPAPCFKEDVVTQTIVVAPAPVANFTAAPQPPVLNTPIAFTNTSSPDAIRFKWNFGDGDTLVTTNRTAPVQHDFNVTGLYNVCLTAFNAAGCRADTCMPVAVEVEAALDVPNAFTPGSGDFNSVVFPRGYNIAKMKFTIWNRWGQKMFETESRNRGWDGRFKGVLQPMDAYAYTLEVEFLDGTKTSKKGDITLIR